MGSDLDLNQLQEKIQKLQAEQVIQPSGGAEMHLVFSLGSVVVSTLLMGNYGGVWIAQRTGYPAAQQLVLVLSILMAIYAVYRLLKPFMKSE